MSKQARPGAPGQPGRASTLSEPLSHKSVVEKQRAAISKLREQNARLKEELLLENKFSVRPSNPGAAALINKLQDEADLFTRKIQLERRKVLMLQQQLEAASGQLGASRTAMGGIFSAREQATAAAKQITILENRLEKQFVKYNEAITHNKQLQEQIDNLRRERLMFEAIDASLDKELARIKRTIAGQRRLPARRGAGAGAGSSRRPRRPHARRATAPRRAAPRPDTITAANEAHVGKDKALAEVAALKLAAEKEHAAFEEEWRQLSHIIEDDRRGREAARQMEMAERERRTQELLKSCEARAAAAGRAGRGRARRLHGAPPTRCAAPARPHARAQASAAGRKKAVRGSWAVGMSKVLAQDVSHEKVRLFGEAFAKIQDATGIQDIDALVAAFGSGEDANYTLFAYVNEARRGQGLGFRVNAEVEALEDNIGRVRQEIEAAQAQARASEAAASAAAGSSLARGAAAEAKAAAYERRLGAAAGVVEQLKGGVGALFDVAGCNTNTVRELLGDALTDANVLAHLGIAYALSKPGNAALQELLHAPPAAPAPSHRIAVDPPSTLEPSAAAAPGPGGAAAAPGLGGNGGLAALLDQGDAAGGEEALPDDVPLTRSQLQAKVTKNLDRIVERSLRVKPVGAGGSAARRR
ncbi:ODA1 [Scenedesmus sp. PABB004]|nr:ODA1 [Scenedesmus sp. PABB004]